MSQDTFNGKKPEENMVENTEPSLFTFEACCAENFGILTVEEGWINWSSSDSPHDKEDMKDRLSSLQSNIPDMKGEVVGLILNGEGRFIDYSMSPEEDDIYPPVDGFEAKDVEDSSSQSGGSQSSGGVKGVDEYVEELKDFCRENEYVYEFSSEIEKVWDDVVLVKGVLELKDDEGGFVTVERFGSNGERPDNDKNVRGLKENAVEIAETRALKRCIKVVLGGGE